MREWLKVAAALAVVAAVQPQLWSQVKATPPASARLYVLDCGMLTPNREGVERYHITMAEAGEIRMPVPCFLVVHPKGTLLWDVGVIPDAVVEAQPQGARADVNPTVSAVVTRTLKSQLAEIGYTPAAITYVAISHAHIDHTANLNAFTASTWLTPRAERDFMWTPNNPRVNPAFFSAWEKSPRVRFIETDEHDVFGDGRVIIKAAPGHTPGHQVLALNLASTGRVVIAGDLYHYPPERTLRRAPPDNEFNVAQSAASRERIEAYLLSTKAALWIEHDFAANAKLKRPPAYYD
jgi:glyoxylase-like metal-dependent hydrolase (beta-lactamase superfamily II)